MSTIEHNSIVFRTPILTIFIQERIVSIVVTRILLIIGASRRPGKEPLDDFVQVFSKLSLGKWNSKLSFILA